MKRAAALPEHPVDIAAVNALLANTRAPAADLIRAIESFSPQPPQPRNQR
jgi:hypothetical protein